MSPFRTILSQAPRNVRIEFLESMSFANGRLVNVRIDGVRNVLGQGDFQALMQSCGCRSGYMCDPFNGKCFEIMDSACNPNNCTALPIPPVTLGVLLQATPSNIRERFLDTLDFEKGLLDCAEVHLVEKHVEEAERKRLPRVTGTHSARKPDSERPS
jgi:hypothetical protein